MGKRSTRWPFEFPLVGYFEQAATGLPNDDGTRRFAGPKYFTTAFLPEEPGKREGMFLVQSDGRRWQITGVRVLGPAGSPLERLYRTIFRVWTRRMEFDVEEREPITLDALKSRLHAALNSNPQIAKAHGPQWSRADRERIRDAASIEDLVQPDEIWYAARRGPKSFWDGWPEGQGRGGRRGFALVGLPGVLAVWGLALSIGPGKDAPGVLVVFLMAASFVALIFSPSATLRRLHDLNRGGGTLAIAFAFVMALAAVHDHFGNAQLNVVLGIVIQVCAAAALVYLLTKPGAPRANRHGPQPGRR